MASELIAQKLPSILTSIYAQLTSAQPDLLSIVVGSMALVSGIATLSWQGHQWQTRTLPGGIFAVCGTYIFPFLKDHLWANRLAYITGFAVVAILVAFMWLGCVFGRGIDQPQPPQPPQPQQSARPSFLGRFCLWLKPRNDPQPQPQPRQPQRNVQLSDCVAPVTIILLATCVLFFVFISEDPRGSGGDHDSDPLVHREIEKIVEWQRSWKGRVYALLPIKQEGFHKTLADFSDYSVKDRMGRTPLMLSVELRRLDLAEWLLPRTYPRSSWVLALGETNDDGDALTHIAARKGDVALLEWIADKILPLEAQTLNTQLNSQGMRPIHIAAKHGRKKVLNFLIKKGVPLSQQDNNGLTIGHHAARAGRVDVLRWINDNDGWSPKKAEGLSRHAEGIAREAERYGQFGPLEYFYFQNTQVTFDAKDEEGHTIAMRAAASGNLKLLQWLSERGVDLNSEVSLSLLAHSGRHPQCAAYLHIKHKLPDASDPTKVASILQNVPWETMMGKSGVSVLRWLHHEYPKSSIVHPFYHTMMTKASKLGHVRILEQIVNGCNMPLAAKTDGLEHTIAHHASYLGTASTFHWIFQQSGGHELMKQANLHGHLPVDVCQNVKYPVFCDFLARNS